MKKSLLIIFSILFISHFTFAQDKSPADKYAVEAMKEFFAPDGDKEKAIEICEKGLRKDSNYAKLWEYKAGFEYELKKYKDAYKSYNKLLELEPDNMNVYFTYGLVQKNLLMFDEAKVSLNKYLDAKIKRSPQYENLAKEIVNNIDAIKKLYGNKVDFLPQNLGSGINTEDGEYWPGITLDGKYFYFTRMVPHKGHMTEDFYRSELIDSTWSVAEKLPAPVNTPNNEGTISISADGKYIFFSSMPRIAANGQQLGYGSIDLYISVYNDGNWSSPINLGPRVNSKDWDSQPSISPDGLTLYFSSTRPGGYGGADIYMSVYQNGSFQAPVNLGPEINTSGEEQSPFIHYDNRTLLFSSTGHVGAGGSDIFVVKKDEQGVFGMPVNVGVPINTENNELGLIVDRLGQFGYLSAERPEGKGGLDIYKFELPASIRPEPVSYVSGTVFDAQTKEKISAEIELTDLKTGELISTIKSGKDGSFLLILKPNMNYMLTVDKMNYLFYSANFSLTQHSSLDPYYLEVPLSKPEINKEVVLNNVFFETDKFDLKAESKLELDKLVHLLKKFPFMKIEIGGHTDNTGDASKNQTLSQNRAKAVKEYLVSKGVDATRLTSVGYGDKQPVADNGTAEGRAQNRRTAFKVISVN